jgi:hypothetical protein
MLAAVAGLLCCPFCRDVYTRNEQVHRCPTCEVELVPFNQAPPSPEVRLEQDLLLEQTLPEWRKLPFWDMRRGRGFLLVLAAAGLFSYALPWFEQTMPEPRVLTGFQLARHHVGWLWGGAVGWFILIALALSRRCVADMRGVRIIATVLASLTAAEILVFVNVTAPRQDHVLVRFAWDWGLWVACFVSALGACAAARFGGPLPENAGREIEARANRTRPRPAQAATRQTLH